MEINVARQFFAVYLDLEPGLCHWDGSA
jgi:hypothetical protein